jgi:hypothetical protein
MRSGMKWPDFVPGLMVPHVWQPNLYPISSIAARSAALKLCEALRAEIDSAAYGPGRSKRLVASETPLVALVKPFEIVDSVAGGAKSRLSTARDASYARVSSPKTAGQGHDEQDCRGDWSRRHRHR